MDMEEKEAKPISCICENHRLNLDVFKESGTWIVLCHECDRLEYSNNKDRAISKWNNNIEKEKNTIHFNVSLKNEMYEGLNRWVHNVVARWYEEYGEPMSQDEIEDLESLFMLQLEEKNKKFL